MTKPINDAERARAIALRAQGLSYRAIARKLGCPMDWAETLVKGRRYRPGRAREGESETLRSTSVDAHALAERDHRLSLPPRSLTAALMGDPEPGRSALDRQGGQR